MHALHESVGARVIGRGGPPGEPEAHRQRGPRRRRELGAAVRDNHVRDAEARDPHLNELAAHRNELRCIPLSISYLFDSGFAFLFCRDLVLVSLSFSFDTV